MKALITIACAAFIFAPLARAEGWHVTSSTDPMTDVTTYTASIEGTPIDVMQYVSYKPSLCYRATPIHFTPDGKLSHRIEIFFAIDTDGLRRGRSQVALRFDRDPATNYTITASTDRRAGFFDFSAAFRNRLVASSNVLIRYTTTLGNIRTTRFPTAGLDQALEDIKRSCRKSGKVPTKQR